MTQIRISVENLSAELVHAFLLNKGAAYVLHLLQKKASRGSLPKHITYVALFLKGYPHIISSTR